MKPTTKKVKRQAKKQFPRKPHSTRPFSMGDYDRLPKGTK